MLRFARLVDLVGALARPVAAGTSCGALAPNALIATTTGAEARCTAFAAPCRCVLVPPAASVAADGALLRGGAAYR